MASQIISTMMMFTSDGVKFLILILLAGFFIFYTDVFEWKKKWKARRSKRYKEGRANRSSKLEKLNALKDAGLLSKEEYQARKREIR